jgi:hypothetical protein
MVILWALDPFAGDQTKVFGLWWSKSSEQHGKISIVGVLRLRAIKPASPDRPVRRFAQDDVFVGALTKLS